MSQNLSSAVMQQRHEAPDSFDDFPTPPWATRAALKLIREHFPEEACFPTLVAREPCANRGYMARPLAEVFFEVIASDIFDYGSGYPLVDYLFPGPMDEADWTFMNPPFNLAFEFLMKSFETPRWSGTAAFVRSGFLESEGRYNRLFSVRPPTLIAQFAERVILHKAAMRDPGELYWDGAQMRKPSTATSYCWMFWVNGREPRPFAWIPPCRKKLERPGDYKNETIEQTGAIKCSTEESSSPA